MLIQVNKLTKSYSLQNVFENITFTINQQDRVGLVGPNGCGKTTLFKCLTQQEELDQGEIFQQKGLTLGYLEQSANIQEELQVNEVLRLPFSEIISLEERLAQLEQRMSEQLEQDELNRLLNEYAEVQKQFDLLDGYSTGAKIERVCQGLGITEAQRFSSYGLLSGGEKTKIGLAVLLLKEPQLLLLDEPTNHLDLRALEWLEEYLKEFQGAVLIISHDRYFLDRVANKIFDLEDGELTIYHGNYTSYVSQKEERLLLEFQTFQEQQNKIKKMKEAIKRYRIWGNQSDNPKFHRRANSIQKALDRMEKIKRPQLEKQRMGLSFEAEKRSGRDVVSIESLSMSFDNRYLFNEVNMLIRYQEKVAVLGDNGTGKSTLFKLLLGQLEPSGGSIKLGSNVKIGYLSQAGIEEDLDQTVLEAYRSYAKVDEGEARHRLAYFLFYGPAVFKKVQDLSGGEKMRLRFAQLMTQDCNLLLLDEPTNHLDIDSREVLEEALTEFTGTVIAISHDRYFINKLFKQLYWLENRNFTAYLGSYDDAKRKKLELAELHTGEPMKKSIVKGEKAPIAGKAKQEKSKGPSSNYSLQLEESITRIEMEIKKLNESLYADSSGALEELQQRSLKLAQLVKERDHLLEEWMDLQ